MLKIEAIPGKGRGVRASRAIAAGTLIERAPAIRLPAAERPLIDQTTVFVYYFADPVTYREGADYDCLLAFGLSTFCNHAAQPNAVVSWEEDPLGLWALLTAIDDIAEEDEVTVFYTNVDQYKPDSFFV
ncbi:SET domain-containing protein [Pelagibius litoralis]|uniref:SET domain-containing protein n=1 Tax=Pelagibius litoralis TaxID=374515 RepID=A0A967EUQ8_9PROT|nr:SET domain-containing protein-lysine N-methyltransferase [Pelagibius litoralis]NIA67382.1 SET domain-containing protein [Pelagibius litoralis]